MTSRRTRIAAAVVALTYLGIQGFQECVFRTLPDPATPAQELMLGAHPLHLVRSTAMLFAMFALVFVYGVVCLQRIRARPVLARFTFLAFLMFGILEIMLRSVELVWTQVKLPAAYAAAPDPAILDKAATFGAVQHALYLPLGSSVLIGSVLAVWLFASGRKIDRVIQAVFLLNVLRNTARMLTTYAGLPIFSTGAYEAAYFPMVVAFYVPLAYWLIKRPADVAAGELGAAARPPPAIVALASDRR